MMYKIVLVYLLWVRNGVKRLKPQIYDIKSLVS